MIYISFYFYYLIFFVCSHDFVHSRSATCNCPSTFLLEHHETQQRLPVIGKKMQLTNQHPVLYLCNTFKTKNLNHLMCSLYCHVMGGIATVTKPSYQSWTLEDVIRCSIRIHLFWTYRLSFELTFVDLIYKTECHR